MSSSHTNNYPKLHNAMWPGLVGKGSPGAEPAIDLDTMLDLTAQAQVDGIRFDGVDLFLFDPHVSIDADEDGIKRLADKVAAKGFVVGSVVAPVWEPTGGGSALGNQTDREKFVGQVRKACHIAKTLRELGVRPEGVVRIDSACSVADWAQDPEGNQQRIAQTFAEACDVAESFGERLAAEGEICWGGMHSWKKMLDLLERVNRPRTLGFQADMAHTLLYIVGYNAPEDALLPADWDWSDPARLDEALKILTDSLRPWTIDFHVAQNDATVKGSGSHDKTGHHCLPNDPNGKLDIPRHAGFWLRAEGGKPSKAFRHICWDGCMFPNAVMSQPETWNDILAAMVAVRDAHGWVEPADEPAELPTLVVAEIEAEIDLVPAEAEIDPEAVLPEAPEAAPAEPPEPAPEPVAPARAKAKPVKAPAAAKKVSKPHFVKPAKVKRVQPTLAKVKRVPAKPVKAKHVRTKPAKAKQVKAKPAVAKRSLRAKLHRAKTARKSSPRKKPSTRVSRPKRAVARKKTALRGKRNR
jgi:sugar phosphate isomerase/epimerase